MKNKNKKNHSGKTKQFIMKKMKNKKLRVLFWTIIFTTLFHFAVEKINNGRMEEILSTNSIRAMKDLNQKYGGVKIKPVFKKQENYLKAALFFAQTNVFDSVDLDQDWDQDYDEGLSQTKGEVILKLQSQEDDLKNVFRLKADQNVDLVEMAADYAQIEEVEYAEPNFALEIFDEKDQYHPAQVTATTNHQPKTENRTRFAPTDNLQSQLLSSQLPITNQMDNIPPNSYEEITENLWTYIVNSDPEKLDEILKLLNTIESRAQKESKERENKKKDKKRFLNQKSQVEKEKFHKAAAERVIVAVVDSGFDQDHPFLKDFVWLNEKEVKNGQDDDKNGLKDDLIGWDFTSDSNKLLDDLGHGTHVSGIVVAQINKLDFDSVVTIMPVKVFGGGRFSSVSSVVRGIKYAADSGADIINLSLGGPKKSKFLQDAIRYAQKKNAKIISAAGNKGKNMKFYPASFDDVISVAAISDRGTKTHISNFDETVDLAAPGDRIYSSLPQNKYGYLSGTSQASPFVAGIAAKKMSQNATMKKNFALFSRYLLEDVTPFSQEIQEKFPDQLGKGYFLGEKVTVKP